MTERDLIAQLREMGSAVVAFSGGVDSAVVLAAAVRALGDKALAVTATSSSVAQGEVEGALRLSRDIGAVHDVIETREFDDPRYRANPVNRCYFCKEELYSRLAAIARQRGFLAIVDGCNADDGRAPLDRRPGRAAAAAFGVRSPLAELGLGKDAVRAIASRFGLSVWDKPATPCLSSRVPYGTRIEVDDLRRVDLAEQYLRASGFATVRVRHYGDTARVEVPQDDVDRLRLMKQRVARALAAVGYRDVEIDARGYRVGSLNEKA
jgi:uncharacterized protein